MKVCFINPPFKAEYGKFSRESRSPSIGHSGVLYYPLWLIYAACVAEKNGFEVAFIDAPAKQMNKEQTLERVKKEASDAKLFVFDTSTPSIYSDVEFAGIIKKMYPNAFTMLVGTHPSATPDETMGISELIDGLARHEYDYIVRDTAIAIRDGADLATVRGLTYRKDGEVVHNPDAEHMLRKDMEVAQKEVSRAKSELDLKDDEWNALKDEMIRVIRGKSSIDRDMIQQLLDANQAAIQAAQDALTAAQNKLEEIEQENKKAENDCSNLFTWASTYQNASFQQRQAILNQFIKEVRVGRDYDIEIILNVPLEEFEEFKSHSLSVRTPSGRKTDLKQAPVRGLGTPNGGIVVFDKTSGEAMNIMPKSSAHVTLRCQDE